MKELFLLIHSMYLYIGLGILNQYFRIFRYILIELWKIRFDQQHCYLGDFMYPHGYTFLSN